jgi:structure-specific endonuclease subunit SLX1
MHEFRFQITTPHQDKQKTEKNCKKYIKVSTFFFMVVRSCSFIYKDIDTHRYTMNPIEVEPAAPEAPEADAKEFFVYLLESSCKRATYVGATVNLERRLRQHNKEISGGAHATGVKVARGQTWRRACHVTGFPTWQAALQFEWRFKQLTRREPSIATQTPLERRKSALQKLLNLTQSTSKAIPYAAWPSGGPVVIWE